MNERAKPPAEISAIDFFTRWVPQVVAHDEQRRARLGGTVATIVFRLQGEGGGDFSVRIAEAVVRGEAGADAAPDLLVTLDVATWRELNSGAISAPQALLRRRVKLEGDFLLGLKLHLILG